MSVNCMFVAIKPCNQVKSCQRCHRVLTLWQLRLVPVHLRDPQECFFWMSSNKSPTFPLYWLTAVINNCCKIIKWPWDESYVRGCEVESHLRCPLYSFRNQHNLQASSRAPFPEGLVLIRLCYCKLPSVCLLRFKESPAEMGLLWHVQWVK